MKLHLDISKGYHSSRVGLNMYSLPTGEYTVVFELYFPSASINHSTVQISASSSIRTVSRTSTDLFSDHSRSIIHLHKYNNTTPNHLMTDMVLKNKSGISYTQDLVILVIVYGISGFHNNVLLSVWDKNHEITNGTLNLITPDKKTKELKIQDASNDDNPITKKVFDEKTESVFYYCNNLELIMRLLLNFQQFQAEIHLYQIIHTLV